MRKRQPLIAFIALCSFGHLFGQSSASGAVPSVIKNDFVAAYPASTDVEWERDGELYKVEFETAEDVDHEIWYDANATILREEIEISTEELPPAVLRAVAADFAGYSVDDAERVVTPDGETYQMELEALLKEDWEVTFTADGRLLSKTED